jgi:hypothetical protein
MAISVATLIDRAKALSDKRNDASVTPDDWTTYVNWGSRSLDRFIASLDPAFRFSQADFTLTASAAGARKNLSTLTWLDEDGTAFGYSPQFAALHGVDVNPDTPQRRTIPRRNFRERNRGQIGWWTPAIPSPLLRYDMRGRTIVVGPFEAAADSYRVYARLQPYLFTGPTDANPLDYQLEPYDEYIAMFASRLGLKIEESSPDFETQRMLELRDEIIAEHTRDDGEATVIADVEDFDGYGD